MRLPIQLAESQEMSQRHRLVLHNIDTEYGSLYACASLGIVV